jgi:4-amino-4-deoxy-L-arabinose transferase-like glycosyltransferase
MWIHLTEDLAGMKGNSRFTCTPLICVLLVSCGLNLYHIWWGLPLHQAIVLEASDDSRSDQSDPEDVVAWGTDEVAPMGPLVYAKRTFIDRSWFHKYPAFHFIVLNVTYAPFLAYLVLSGQLSLARLSDIWPYGLSDPASALTIFILIARIVSVLMGMAIVGLLYLIAQRLWGRASAIFAALIVAFCFPFIYYSHTSNLEVPYLFWFILGFFFYVRLSEESRPGDYLLLGTFMALAVATKDQAYGLLPFLPLSLLWFRVRRRRDSGTPIHLRSLLASVPWVRLGMALVAFIVTYVLAANIPNNWHGYLRHVKYITSAGSAPYQEFPNTIFGHIALLSKTLSLLAWSLNIPLFAVCAVGLLWGLIRWRGVTLAIIAPALSYYLFFIAVILYVYPRFVLPFVLILALFGGRLLGALWTSPGRFSWMTRPAIAALLLYSLLYGASVDWFLERDPRYEAEKWITHNVSRAADMEAYGPAQYLPRFSEHVRVRRLTLRGYVEEAFRSRAPEYVLLTHAYYRRITEDQQDDFDQEEFIEHLWTGELGYHVAADFKVPEGFAPHLIPGVNSRITVFARSQQGRNVDTSAKQLPSVVSPTAIEARALEGDHRPTQGTPFDALREQ